MLTISFYWQISKNEEKAATKKEKEKTFYHYYYYYYFGKGINENDFSPSAHLFRATRVLRFLLRISRFLVLTSKIYSFISSRM